MPNRPIGLTTYRWSNARRSYLLLGAYPLIVVLFFWCQIYAVQTVLHYREDVSHIFIAHHTKLIFQNWLWLVLIGLCGWFFYAWRNHGAIIRGLCHSYPVTAREEPQLYAILETLCISQGLPTPQLEIIDSDARNSFVCAVDEETYRVFVTRGLLENLSHDEIEAVLAHEIGHILNDDTRLLSISIAFTDLFSFITNLFHHNKHKLVTERAEHENILPALLMHPLAILLLLPLWGGYVLTSLIRVFLFLNRELDADAVAIEITKNPDALMRGLLRIHRRAHLPFVSKDIKFLCIDNPRGGFFATHPRMSTRLKAISAVSNRPIPEIESGDAAPLYNRFRPPELIMRPFKDRKLHNVLQDETKQVK